METEAANGSYSDSAHSPDQGRRLRFAQIRSNALACPDGAERAQLAMDAHNKPLLERRIKAGRLPHAPFAEVAKAKRQLNFYAEMVWRDLALRWYLSNLERMDDEDLAL